MRLPHLFVCAMYAFTASCEYLDCGDGECENRSFTCGDARCAVTCSGRRACYRAAFTFTNGTDASLQCLGNGIRSV